MIGQIIGTDRLGHDRQVKAATDVAGKKIGTVFVSSITTLIIALVEIMLVCDCAMSLTISK
jgi:hypothetical protein